MLQRLEKRLDNIPEANILLDSSKQKTEAHTCFRFLQCLFLDQKHTITFDFYCTCVIAVMAYVVIILLFIVLFYIIAWL